MLVRAKVLLPKLLQLRQTSAVVHRFYVGRPPESSGDRQPVREVDVALRLYVRDGPQKYLLAADMQRVLKKLGVRVKDLVLEYSVSLRPQAWWVRLEVPGDRDKVADFFSQDVNSPFYCQPTEELVDQIQWQRLCRSLCPPELLQSQGRYVLVRTLHQKLTVKELTELFADYDLQGGGIKANKRYSVVRFTSPDEAHRAVRCLNGKTIKGDKKLDLEVAP